MSPSAANAACDVMLRRIVGALGLPEGDAEVLACHSAANERSELRDNPFALVLRARVACEAGRLRAAATAIELAFMHGLEAAAAAVPSVADAAAVIVAGIADLQQRDARPSAELAGAHNSGDAGWISATSRRTRRAATELRRQSQRSWLDAPAKPAAAAAPLPLAAPGRLVAAVLPLLATSVKLAAAAPLPPDGPLTNSAPHSFLEELAKADEAQKRGMLGEKLYPAVASLQPARAGKITGMLLEMDTSEVLHLLKSEALLREIVAEAADVLDEADAAAAAALTTFDSAVSSLASDRRCHVFLAPSPFASPLVDALTTAALPSGSVAVAAIAPASPYLAYPGAPYVRMLCVLGPASVDVRCHVACVAPECWRGVVPSGRSLTLCLTGAGTALISPGVAGTREESPRPAIAMTLDGQSASCRGCIASGSSGATVSAVFFWGLEAYVVAV
jgi:hypothetical protein